MKNTKIFLIGFMGTGKSTVSKCLSKVYGLEQVEMDEQIEKEEGMRIPDIFKEKGEEYFRTLETEFVKHLADRENIVVSCGGGTVMRECNVEEMKRQGKIVLLTARPETIFQRVKFSHNRPLLEGNMNVKYITKLMNTRRPKYEAAADISVRTDGRKTEAICKEIMDKVRG